MRYILVFTLALVASAYAIDLHDQLIQGPGDITQNGEFSGISFSTIDGGYNRWVAADYEPSETVTFKGFDAHWSYYDDDVQPGDVYFEFYQTDLTGAPIGYADVLDANITQTDTGWVLPTSGAIVFFNEMDLDPSDHIVFDNGNAYWIAAQLDTSVNAFVTCIDDIDWEMGWWYGDDGYWISTYNQWGHEVDYSMRFRGDTGDIKSASIGEIKATFK